MWQLHDGALRVCGGEPIGTSVPPDPTGSMEPLDRRAERPLLDHHLRVPVLVRQQDVGMGPIRFLSPDLHIRLRLPVRTHDERPELSGTKLDLSLAIVGNKGLVVLPRTDGRSVSGSARTHPRRRPPMSSTPAASGSSRGAMIRPPVREFARSPGIPGRRATPVLRVGSRRILRNSRCPRRSHSTSSHRAGPGRERGRRLPNPRRSMNSSETTHPKLPSAPRVARYSWVAWVYSWAITSSAHPDRSVMILPP